MNKSGFTLLEMLVSIFIITLILSFVSYNIIGEVRRSQVSSTAMQVQSIVELSRSCALASGAESILSFSNSNASLSCEYLNKNFYFDQVEVNTNFPNNTAKFNKDGVINQGATIDICNNFSCQQVTVGVGSSDAQIK